MVKKIFSKGEVVAVLAPTGSFYLCKLIDSVKQSSTSVKIRWLEKREGYFQYGHVDNIECESILSSVILAQIGTDRHKIKKYDITMDSFLSITEALKDVTGTPAVQTFPDMHVFNDTADRGRQSSVICGKSNLCSQERHHDFSHQKTKKSSILREGESRSVLQRTGNETENPQIASKCSPTLPEVSHTEMTSGKMENESNVYVHPFLNLNHERRNEAVTSTVMEDKREAGTSTPFVDKSNIKEVEVVFSEDNIIYKCNTMRITEGSIVLNGKVKARWKDNKIYDACITKVIYDGTKGRSARRNTTIPPVNATVTCAGLIMDNCSGSAISKKSNTEMTISEVEKESNLHVETTQYADTGKMDDTSDTLMDDQCTGSPTLPEVSHTEMKSREMEDESSVIVQPFQNFNLETGSEYVTSNTMTDGECEASNTEDSEMTGSGIDESNVNVQTTNNAGHDTGYKDVSSETLTKGKCEDSAISNKANTEVTVSEMEDESNLKGETIKTADTGKMDVTSDTLMDDQCSPTLPEVSHTEMKSREMEDESSVIVQPFQNFNLETGSEFVTSNTVTDGECEGLICDIMPFTKVLKGHDINIKEGQIYYKIGRYTDEILKYSVGDCDDSTTPHIFIPNYHEINQCTDPQNAFEKDFAAWENYLNKECPGRLSPRTNIVAYEELLLPNDDDDDEDLFPVVNNGLTHDDMEIAVLQPREKRELEVCKNQGNTGGSASSIETDGVVLEEEIVIINDDCSDATAVIHAYITETGEVVLYENSDFQDDLGCPELQTPRMITDTPDVNGQKIKLVPKNKEVISNGAHSDQKTAAVASKKEAKRIRRSFPCLFCPKWYIRLYDNILDQHVDKEEVIPILSLNERDLRVRALNKLKLRAVKQHNDQVRSGEKEGSIIVARNQAPKSVEKSNKIKSRFVECQYCYKNVKAHLLYRHQKKCLEKGQRANISVTNPKTYERVLVAAGLAGTPVQGASRILNDVVLIPLLHDDIGSVVRGDQLILQVGEEYLPRISHGLHRKKEVSHFMRLLAQFLEEHKKRNHDITCLSDCISGSKYEDIITTIKVMGQFEESSQTFKGHEKVKLLGLLLQTAAELVISNSISMFESEKRMLAEDLIKQFKARWSRSVGVCVNASRKKLKSTLKPPLYRDIKEVLNFIKKEEVETQTLLQKCPNKTTWRRLCEVSLAHTIFFNRRRSGEMERALIKDYTTRHVTRPEDTLSKLFDTHLEEAVKDSLTVFMIQGKCLKRVPVMLTPCMKKSVELLIKFREQCGSNETNEFIFANNNTKKSSIRGDVAIKTMVRKAGNIEQPDLVTAKNLRTEFATAMQYFALDDNEVDMMCRHLGHSRKIHDDYYRKLHAHAELSEVSKLLLLADEGDLYKMKDNRGKRLRNMSVESPPATSSVHESNKSDTSKEFADDPDYIPSSDDEHLNRKDTASCSKRRKLGTRQSWSDSEKAAVAEHFRHYLLQKDGRLPGEDEIKKIIEKDKRLSSRFHSKIKDFVRNNRGKDLPWLPVEK